MSRRHSAEKRKVNPDAKYNSILVTKVVNSLTKDGKKALAIKILYKAIEKMEKDHKVNGFDTFKLALQNIRPFLELKGVKLGAANYQAPVAVDEARGQTLAIRWLITASRARSERTMVNRLSSELFDASNKHGGAIKKRDEVHKMAEANKAFAHLVSYKK